METQAQGTVASRITSDTHDETMGYALRTLEEVEWE